jgi:hypothetical protein
VLLTGSVIAQEDIDSIEVYLIDAYVKPEPPNDFILSFFTSDFCKSKVMIDDRYEYPVSDDLVDMHKTKIEVMNIRVSCLILIFHMNLKSMKDQIYFNSVYLVGLFFYCRIPTWLSRMEKHFSV